MFAPLPILTVLGSTASGTSDRMMVPLQDFAGINLGIASLTGNVAAQAPYASAVKSILPTSGALTYLRSNTYGISSPTNSYPPWMSAGVSYWTNMFRLPAAQSYATGRKLVAEPLAGYNGSGIGPQSSPFGRTSDKAQVANNINTWRSQLRWRMRAILSSDVGPVTATASASDLAAARTTNANVAAIVGPNEVDLRDNWKFYYLDFVNSPDEITTSTPFASITIADTVFNGNLGLLYLRIIDHMRYTYESVNDSLAAGGADRSDCAVIMPSFIRTSRSKGTSDFTIYDFFNYEDMTANVGLRKGEWLKWCDAMQLHSHVDHSWIEDPWAANPLAVVDSAISPYHVWRAKLDNDAYRESLGLTVYPRPLVNGETGLPVQGDGITVDWRPALHQLRRLKYGVLSAGNLYYGVCMILSYSAGLSTNYGYNLLAFGGLRSVDTFAIDDANRGTGYAVGSTYAVNYRSGLDLAATFRVTSIGAGGSITGIRMNYTGYWNTTPPSNVALVAPGGGTAARLDLTYVTVAANTPVGDLGEFDYEYLNEVLDYTNCDISDLPPVGNLAFSIPITAKTWKDYWKDWIVWFRQSQNPIDDVPTMSMMTNRAHLANVGQSSGNFRDVVWRTAFWSSKRAAIDGVKLVFSNIYLDGTGEHNGLNNIFVTASVEYNGAFVPVTFGGAREVQINPGALVTSDTVAISIPTNTQFWTRQNVRTANATEKYATGYTTRADFGEAFSTSSPASQVDATGALTGGMSSAMYAPVAVLGSSLETNPLNVVILGSSSAFGQGETFATLPVPGDRGYLSRLVSNNMGQTVIACSSHSLAGWISASSLRMAIINAIRPTHIIVQLGSNDIQNSATASTVQSRLQTVWNQLATTGAKIIQVTSTPTASGTFTTIGGQTSTFNGVRVAVNNFIRGVPAPLAGIIDACRVTESSIDSGKWRVDGGAWTTDGVHTIRHADIAAALDIGVIS